MSRDSNVGELGIESIRLNGTRIANLPLAEGARARAQLPLVQETERQNKVALIRAQYPPQRTAYLRSRIAECEQNIKNIEGMKARETTTISEYTTLAAQCEVRDKELAQAANEPARKKIRDRFPPYQVKGLRQQIVQSGEAVVRCDEVIAREHTSIAEFREVLVLCEQRDRELRSLGENID